MHWQCSRLLPFYPFVIKSESKVNWLFLSLSLSLSHLRVSWKLPDRSVLWSRSSTRGQFQLSVRHYRSTAGFDTDVTSIHRLLIRLVLKISLQNRKFGCRREEWKIDILLTCCISPHASVDMSRGNKDIAEWWLFSFVCRNAMSRLREDRRHQRREWHAGSCRIRKHVPN